MDEADTEHKQIGVGVRRTRVCDHVDDDDRARVDKANNLLIKFIVVDSDQKYFVN